jgi:hypothetical protein
MLFSPPPNQKYMNRKQKPKAISRPSLQQKLSTIREFLYSEALPRRAHCPAPWSASPPLSFRPSGLAARAFQNFRPPAPKPFYLILFLSSRRCGGGLMGEKSKEQALRKFFVSASQPYTDAMEHCESQSPPRVRNDDARPCRIRGPSWAVGPVNIIHPPLSIILARALPGIAATVCENTLSLCCSVFA